MSNQFSIVTVVKNDLSGLEKTILSVSNQKFDDYEYIVVDGGSTDGTIGIINKYKRFIKRIVSEEDGGIYHAMNKGIKLCKGKYINFLNAGDTFFCKDTLLRIKNNLEENIDILSGSINLIDNHGKTEFKSWQDKNKPDQHMFCYHQTMFTKLQIFKKHDFNTIFKVSADYDWALKCLFANYNFKFVDFPVVNFQDNGFSEVNKLKARIEDLFIQSNYFNCDESLLSKNAFSSLKIYNKGNNYFLPKIIERFNSQLKSFKKYEPNINLYGSGSIINNIKIKDTLNFKNIYDRNFNKINFLNNNLLIKDPSTISSSNSDYFLITALGYENEIEEYLIEKGIKKNHILKFKI